MDKFDQAIALVESGMFDEAKEIFEEMLLEHPKNGDVLYNLIWMIINDVGNQIIVQIQQLIKQRINSLDLPKMLTGFC